MGADMKMCQSSPKRESKKSNPRNRQGRGFLCMNSDALSVVANDFG
jgi:hypothetical protein